MAGGYALVNWEDKKYYLRILKGGIYTEIVMHSKSQHFFPNADWSMKKFSIIYSKYEGWWQNSTLCYWQPSLVPLLDLALGGQYCSVKHCLAIFQLAWFNQYQTYHLLWAYKLVPDSMTESARNYTWHQCCHSDAQWLLAASYIGPQRN